LDIDDIIAKNDFDIDRKILANLESKVADIQKNPAIKESAVKAYTDVLDRYSNFFNENNVIKRSEAQVMKKELNKVTEVLQKKKTAGTLNVAEKAEMQALDEIRAGLKTAIEGGDDIIRELNSKYAGIQEAVTALAKRSDNAKKVVDPTFLQKVAAPVVELVSGATGAGSAAFVGRQALKMEKSLEKLLSDLQKQVKKKASDSESVEQPTTKAKTTKVQTPESDTQESKVKSSSPNPTTKASTSQGLIDEAKKYDSAEEFIKAKQKDVVYHGSTEPINKFDDTGAFFTDDMMNAEGYGGGENLYEGFLD